MEVSGAILIDKPPLVTSYDIIRELKPLLQVKKIGHTGTLDPIATGLMILLLGTATRLAQYFLHLNKVYKFTVKFGEETDTMDSEGTVTKKCDYSSVTSETLRDATKSLHGVMEQYPPIYSAIKYKGRHLYEYARKGQKVELHPRMVNIIRLSMDDFSPPYALFTAEVSSGTYIRSLAKSIGDVIECCAHVTALRRLSVGDFHVEQAVQLQDIKQRLECEDNKYSFLIDRETLLNKIKI
jgi:tRNA pseudouridine55 synthase